MCSLHAADAAAQFCCPPCLHIGKSLRSRAQVCSLCCDSTLLAPIMQSASQRQYPGGSPSQRRPKTAMAVPTSGCRGALLCLKMYMVMWLRRNTAPCPPAGKVLGPLFGCKKACTDATTQGCLADPELCVYTRWSLCPPRYNSYCAPAQQAPLLCASTPPHIHHALPGSCTGGLSNSSMRDSTGRPIL